MLVPLLSSFTLLDFIALGLLLFAWVGTGLVIEHPPKSRASVTVLMRRYRSDWMTEMLTRKPRIFDATILGSLRQGTTFLTSAAMIAVGGVLALAGQPQTLDSLVMGVGIEGHPVIFWQTKLGVVALLLMHAVFKFIWSNRLFGYCAVVMASAEINIRAATNFNRGLRSVYFALAGLAWILGPWGLMLAVAVTGWSVLSREFASTSRGVLLED